MVQKISTDFEWPPEVTACVKADIAWLHKDTSIFVGTSTATIYDIFVNSCFGDDACKDKMYKTHRIYIICLLTGQFKL